MDVHDLQKQAEINAEKKVQLWNPDSEDFTVKYIGKEYTARSLEMTTFSLPIALHLKKHLANYIHHKRGTKINASADLIKIQEEINV